MTDLFSQQETRAKAIKPISVSEVSKKIQEVLDGRIGKVAVIGQVNSPKLGHHWYFTLSDGDSKIDCAMWASKVSANGKGKLQEWKPKQGDKVVIHGTVGHYAKFGKTQIYVDRIAPEGEEKGALQLQYEALLKEFREAGWFDEEHKKPLPKYPQRIAVITSAASAAVQDVIETTRRRMPSVELLIINVAVQGDAAATAVEVAIQRVDASAQSMGIDAIIVTRGGGGLEELWSFNDKGVVEAAFHCQTPLVAAIGHESDTSIIELVADHRASTPTQAAMVLVPDRDELLQMVEHGNVRLSSVTARCLERMVSSLLHVERRVQVSVTSFLHCLTESVSNRATVLAAKRPHALVQARQKRVLLLESSLLTASTKKLTIENHRIGSLESRLESIGPLEVLRRGFSLTQDSSGKIVRSSKNVKEGDQIRTVLADGAIKSKVECST